MSLRKFFKPLQEKSNLPGLINHEIHKQEVMYLPALIFSKKIQQLPLAKKAVLEQIFGYILSDWNSDFHADRCHF